VLILVVPLAALSGLLTIWLLYGVALLGSFCNAFGLVARQSYLPQLAGRANLIESNAKLGGIEQVTRLAGPSVAGQLIAALTAPLALLVTAASLAVSSVSILLIRRPDLPREERTRNLWAEVFEGLRFVFANRLTRATVTSISWTNLWGLAYSSMLVFFLAQTLRQSPGVIGAFLSVSAVSPAPSSRAGWPAAWVTARCCGFRWSSACRSCSWCRRSARAGRSSSLASGTPSRNAPLWSSTSSTAPLARSWPPTTCWVA
jgi:hypothetical protein